MMDALQERIDALHRQLGIPADYAKRTGLPLQSEPETLVTVVTRDERTQQLTPGAAARWAQLEAAAERDAIRLILISSFRSIDYQAHLIERKLSHGLAIDDILKVNAAPGYSEHHSGRAVDVSVPDEEPLTESFENTAAFAWLQRNADHWGFTLSYPRDNPYGIIYEPWHWAVPEEQV